eukprot:5254286-Pleurochrysis_carterae.AAC.1
MQSRAVTPTRRLCTFDVLQAMLYIETSAKSRAGVAQAFDEVRRRSHSRHSSVAPHHSRLPSSASALSLLLCSISVFRSRRTARPNVWHASLPLLGDSSGAAPARRQDCSRRPAPLNSASRAPTLPARTLPRELFLRSRANPVYATSVRANSSRANCSRAARHGLLPSSRARRNCTHVAAS